MKQGIYTFKIDLEVVILAEDVSEADMKFREWLKTHEDKIVEETGFETTEIDVE